MRVLRPCPTQPVNHCSNFLLPPPPLSPAHTHEKKTHICMQTRTMHPQQPTFLSIFHPHHPHSLDDKMKDADIHPFSVAALKESYGILGNPLICHILKHVCHFLNGKRVEMKNKKDGHGDCAAASVQRLQAQMLSYNLC